MQFWGSLNSVYTTLKWEKSNNCVLKTPYFFNVENQNKNLDENILQYAVLSTFYTAFDVALNAMCIDNKNTKQHWEYSSCTDHTKIRKKCNFGKP